MLEIGREEKEREREIDRQIDRQTDRQTDRRTDRDREHFKSSKKIGKVFILLKDGENHRQRENSKKNSYVDRQIDTSKGKQVEKKREINIGAYQIKRVQ